MQDKNVLQTASADFEGDSSSFESQNCGGFNHLGGKRAMYGSIWYNVIGDPMQVNAECV